MTLPDLDLSAAYRTMFKIRCFEQALLSLFSEGFIDGTVHTCIGQEAVALGTMLHFDPKIDIVCSNHRGHGHYLAYCGDYYGLIAEIVGLPSGVCGAVGGSQHLHRDNFYSNGILGGMSPVSVGMAKAEKLNRTGAVVSVFHGDGAMAEGVVYESINMAGLWRLPFILFIEHNHYAQSTHWAMQHSGCLKKRMESFGLTVSKVDGNDVEAVYHCVASAMAQARDCQPQAVILETYRLGPHSKGDDLREESEILRHKKNCPIERLERKLAPLDCKKLREAVIEEIDLLVQRVKEERIRWQEQYG